jgi:hypothetical protein
MPPLTDYGLMAAELIRLAAAGRIEISQNRVVVLSPEPTGDTGLDAALSNLDWLQPPLVASAWVRRPRPLIRLAYLGRLVQAGILREDAGVLRDRLAQVASGQATIPGGAALDQAGAEVLDTLEVPAATARRDLPIPAGLQAAASAAMQAATLAAVQAVQSAAHQASTNPGSAHHGTGPGPHHYGGGHHGGSAAGGHHH